MRTIATLNDAPLLRLSDDIVAITEGLGFSGPPPVRGRWHRAC
jgi:hypothetical protein